MTSCTGCNVALGWKKYNFQKQWHVFGYFCRDCMEKIGHDFDDHGKVTLPKRECDSCKQEFFFLTSWQSKQGYRCCQVCKDLGYDESQSTQRLHPVPPVIPVMMASFAVFGLLLMLGGFVYVILVAPQQEANILHVIIGSCMSGAGFILARKMIRVRNVILGKSDVSSDTEMLG